MPRAVPIALLFLIASAPHAPAQTTRPLSETQKIERLIQAVAELKDATFVRNGKEHSAPDAAKHMRDKWHAARKHIKTAEDFIEKAASRSSVSGKPYLIRFKDGREVESGTFLREELKKLIT